MSALSQHFRRGPLRCKLRRGYCERCGVRPHAAAHKGRRVNDDQGRVGLYRIEVGCSQGTGRLRIAGGMDTSMKESIHRAFAYLQAQKGTMGIAQALDSTDFYVEAIDLLTNHIPCEAGVTLVIAVHSALKKTPRSQCYVGRSTAGQRCGPHPQRP